MQPTNKAILIVLIAITTSSISWCQDAFADVVIDAYFEPTFLWSDWYGSDPFSGCNEYSVTPDVATGDTDQFVALPRGSWIVLGFTDNTIINAPNADDIFIEEIGASNEFAILSVSNDFGVTFTELGLINGGITNAIDLQDYNYNGCVNAIKIEGTDAGGCVPGFDVVRVFGLIGANIESTVLSASICEGESYSGSNAFDGLTEPGIYRDTFASLTTGCDSIVTLVLDVGSTYDYIEQAEICAGESYDGYQLPGLYIDTFNTVGFGCDSIRLLELDVLTAGSSELSASICLGESYEGYTSAGQYVDFFDVPGEPCDSIRTINLTVTPPAEEVIPVRICENEDYNGLTETGRYRDTLTRAAISGCDSIVIIDLEVVASTTTQVTEVICDGESVLGYSVAGTYEETLASIDGCDSTVLLTLEVIEPTRQSVDTTICSGRSVDNYTIDGTYIDTLVSAVGCDSIRTLGLTTVDELYTNIRTTICAGNAFAGYREAGIYIDTIAVTESCDSIITIELEVIDVVLPNIFSPNGDSNNDFFKIGATLDSMEIEQLTIYDRWGNAVYHNEDFQATNPSFWWDGNTRGQRVQSGVYTYFISVACDESASLMYSGTVTVVR